VVEFAEYVHGAGVWGNVMTAGSSSQGATLASP
jgi:hypothetical protein